MSTDGVFYIYKETMKDNQLKKQILSTT